MKEEFRKDKLIKETETHKYYETPNGIRYVVPKDIYPT